MNCKSIQKSLAVEADLGPRGREHIEACPECSDFAAYCGSVRDRLVSSRPLLPDEDLIERRVAVGRNPGWKTAAMASVCALVVVAPIATYLIKGRQAASNLKQSYHVALKGTSYVFGDEQPIDAEAWFDGTRLRFSSHDPAMDQIMWVEGGTCWRSWKPDGVLKTEKAKMASPEKSPSEFVSEGRYASAKFFELMLRQYAPITPSTLAQAESGTDRTEGGRMSVARYQIKPHHVGMVNRWQEDFKSTVWVYTSRPSGKIVRIRQSVDEGNGKTATIQYDYDYGSILASEFDPNTLGSTPNTVPARRVDKAGG